PGELNKHLHSKLVGNHQWPATPGGIPSVPGSRDGAQFRKVLPAGTQKRWRHSRTPNVARPRVRRGKPGPLLQSTRNRWSGAAGGAAFLKALPPAPIAVFSVDIYWA